MELNVIGAIIAGLVGTAVMTLLMMIAPKMGMPKMDIMGMLGSMFTENETSARAIGAVVHFMMGAIFGIIYALLWGLGIGQITVLWGIIFGIVHAIIVIVVMPMMMRMHPRPPEMAGGPMVSIGQLMGHAVFGIVVALVYGALV